MTDSPQSAPRGVEASFAPTDLEELLKRGLVRLSIAAAGVDPLLDERLQQLRVLLRSECSASDMAELLPDLERAVLAVDTEREQRMASITKHLHSLVEQLLDRDLPPDTRKTLRTIRDQLSTPMYYASAYHAVLEQLVPAQAQTLRSAPGSSGGGLLARLFQRNDGPDVSAEEAASEPQTASEAPVHTGVISDEGTSYSQVAAHVEGILLDLLNQLEVADHQQGLSDQLKLRITEGLNWYELAAVLDQMSQLILLAQQSRQGDFERYLQQLNERLAQFQGNLEDTHSAYSGSLDAGVQLEGAIRDQVEGLHEDVREASDLNSLKATVESKLTLLMHDVEEARSVRQQREHEVSERLNVMVERIQVMEVEAHAFRAHLEEQRQRSLLDNLTGMPNRAGLQKRMEEEYERWQRYGGQLLLAVLDVDHFKSINDGFGHLAGDKVLRLIAQQLSRRLRKSDFIGRFGGEEFVLLLPGTSPEQGETVLEALRSGIEECPFHFKTERVTVTVSIGFTAFQQGDELDAVFERADKAMYAAKAAGRNRLIRA
ncbi:MAG: GGDEF domain-containing protein [Pseudomonadaceae bacterium]|nr:MAG: GGDEF domain-containing protein [Pseudomonadaceae bacterium]